MLGRIAFPTYRYGAMHFAIQAALFEMLSGPCKRLIVECPPQHYKSSLISQLFTSWLLLSDPTRKLILLSYSSELAESHSQISRQIVSEYGQRLTGAELDPNRKRAAHWFMKAGGYLKSASTMSAVTGTAAHGVIVDDCYKGSEDSASPTMRQKIFETFASCAETRLSPDGFIVIVGTPWHPEGLPQELLRTQPDKWKLLRLPALAHEDDPLGRPVGAPLLPERYPIEWYKSRRDDYESRAQIHVWNALYDMNPTGNASVEWGEYLRESIWLNPDQMPRQYRFRVLALDPSKSKHDHSTDYSSFSDVILDNEGHLYCRTYAQRATAETVIDTAVALLKANRFDCFLVESNMLQSLFADAILKECQRQGIGCPILHHESRENKIVRCRLALGPLLAQKRLHLLSDSVGNKLLLSQLQAFPSGTHDDCVDSLSHATVALNHILAGPRKSQPAATVLSV